jgi:hypothetical protein
VHSRSAKKKEPPRGGPLPLREEMQELGHRIVTRKIKQLEESRTTGTERSFHLW